MSRRFEFTKDSVSSFCDRPQKSKRLYVYCSAERGLLMAVSHSGSKSFYYHGRVRGKPERIPLGRFPETTVKQAKSRCVIVRAALEQGRDPRLALTVSRRRRGQVTLRDFFEVWMDGHARQKRKRAELAEQEFRLYCSDIADQPIASITSDQLRRWHAAVGAQSGHPTANKAIGLLSSVFAKAVLWERPEGGRYVESNPATAGLVERFKERSRDRYMDRDEVRRYWDTVQNFEPAGGRHFFALALLTAQRKQTIMSMRFENIDTSRWIWTVPDLKGDTVNHPVPLVPQAQRIIELRREYSRSAWVFQAKRRGGTHIQNVDFWFKQIKLDSDIENLRIHDIRRTMASYMMMATGNYALVAQLLAHTLPGPTQIYARVGVEPVRDAIIAALEEMEIGQ